MKELNEFFDNPHPLFFPTLQALWSGEWQARHQMLQSLMTCPPTENYRKAVRAKGMTSSVLRSAALKDYIATSMNGSSATTVFITFTDDAVRFDSLSMVTITTDKTKPMFAELAARGADMADYASCKREAMILALAIAWRIVSGETDFSF